MDSEKARNLLKHFSKIQRGEDQTHKIGVEGNAPSSAAYKAAVFTFKLYSQNKALITRA